MRRCNILTLSGFRGRYIRTDVARPKKINNNGRRNTKFPEYLKKVDALQMIEDGKLTQVLFIVLLLCYVVLYCYCCIVL